LCAEAIRLARLLVELMPDEPEALGLLSMIVLHDARRSARLDAAGELVTLEEQDRSLWDREAIDEARRILDKAMRFGRPGPYQLHAAISAIHATAATAAETDWAEIELLYERLAQMAPTPVVALNRAVAVAMAEGGSRPRPRRRARAGRRPRRLPAARHPRRPPAAPGTRRAGARRLRASTRARSDGRRASLPDQTNQRDLDQLTAELRRPTFAAVEDSLAREAALWTDVHLGVWLFVLQTNPPIRTR
jgi:hypothetical protein